MGEFDPIVILRLYPKGISQEVGRAEYTKILIVFLRIILKNLEKIPQMSNNKLLLLKIRVHPYEGIIQLY